MDSTGTFVGTEARRLLFMKLFRCPLTHLCRYCSITPKEYPTHLMRLMLQTTKIISSLVSRAEKSLILYFLFDYFPKFASG